MQPRIISPVISVPGVLNRWSHRGKWAIDVAEAAGAAHNGRTHRPLGEPDQRLLRGLRPAYSSCRWVDVATGAQKAQAE